MTIVGPKATSAHRRRHPEIDPDPDHRHRRAPISGVSSTIANACAMRRTRARPRCAACDAPRQEHDAEREQSR